LSATGAVWLNPPEPDGMPQPPDPSSSVVAANTTLLIEIPADFLALKAADPTRALRWRMDTRATFQVLFRQGYGVTEFLHESGPDPRTVYVLTQTSFSKEPTA
jgi:predicted GNAT superfamily acetyltransferase